MSEEAMSAEGGEPVAEAPVSEAPVTEQASAAPSADDWRTPFAGGDAERLAALQRFSDPTAYDKAFRDTQTALRQKMEGYFKVPDEDASDEDVAAFRAQMGIPDAVDGYERLAPPEGIELSDADNAFIDQAFEQLHKQGGITASPQVAATLQALYHDALAARNAQAQEISMQARAKVETDLKTSWGHDYDVNMKYAQQAVQAYFDNSSEDDNILEVQLMDGSRLGDNEQFIRAMTAAGRAMVGDPQFLAAVNTQGPASADEIQGELDKMRAWRTGTPEEQRKYAEVSAPGGKYEQMLERLERARQR